MEDERLQALVQYCCLMYIVQKEMPHPGQVRDTNKVTSLVTPNSSWGNWLGRPVFGAVHEAAPIPLNNIA